MPPTGKVTNNMPPEARGKRIKFIRKQLLGLSREEFSDDNFLTKHSLKAWELAWGGGLTENGAKKIVTRAKALGVHCTIPWLMHEIGQPATLISPNTQTNDQETEQIAKELLLFRQIPHAVDTIMQDDTMIPIIYPNNYVGGIITDNIHTAIGKECIISDIDNHIYVRMLEQDKKKNCYNLVALNPNPNFGKRLIPQVQVKWAAPVLWIRRQQTLDP